MTRPWTRKVLAINMGHGLRTPEEEAQDQKMMYAPDLKKPFHMAVGIVIGLSIMLVTCLAVIIFKRDDTAYAAGLKKECADLEASAADWKKVVDLNQSESARYQHEMDALRSQEPVLRAMAAGSDVRYALSVKLAQSHFTLSLKQHAKDAMNAETFELMVDRITYENAKPGDDLFKSFRTGSALLTGSLGSWSITVLSKRPIITPKVEQ